MKEIPSIDINFDPLRDEAKSHTFQKIREACSSTGFFSISNHGIPIEILENCWKSAIQFFRQSESEKMKVGMPFPGYPYGFVPMEQETLARSKGESAAPDLKESFSIGPGLKSPPGLSAEEAQFVFSENQWPENPKDFKNSWEICYKSLSDCSDRLMKLLALALNLPENWFEGFFLNPISAMRVNYYPELVKEPKDNQLRASAHSDYGSLTLLLQDEGESGLEILNRDKEWISVKPSKPDLVVNIGDLMERWTNGIWVSSLHRVRIPKTDIQKTKSRMSLAFFQQPDWDARIECIPSCLGTEGSKYETVTSGRHLMQSYQKTVINF